ncbi:A-kinase anchor protein 9 isoform X1 [Anopheles gambiae]|uniref:Pericentrin/AKAP-450 centrosomal targeting domain-containing protein n=1 Tax=Anopheles coluzzii TaxID=1518534 RepID=A0A6E8W3M9_ANOCL|nr:A-kinase anchor protein 9 isoform X1 [Anopheles coluzzii]XP_061519073.1 A-kinase anchor protein 9 isoform X1 [Anopheles gambiae]
MNRLKLKPLKLPREANQTTSGGQQQSEEGHQGPAAKKAFATGVTSGSSIGSAGSASASKSTSSYGSRKESSVRFRLEDELLGSGSELSGEGSASASISESLSANDNHDDDSLEIMEEIIVPPVDNDHDDDDDDEQANVAEISSASVPTDGNSDDSSSSRSAEVIALNRSKKKGSIGSAVADRKRQLFDIGEDEDFLPRSAERPPSGGSGSGLFDIDRLQLSGDEIAQHFQTTVESDRSEKEDSPFRDRPKSSENEEYEDSFGQDGGEGESSVGERASGKGKSPKRPLELVQVHHAKELSPLKEDDVLINDSKVNLNALKQRNQPIVQRGGIRLEEKARNQKPPNVMAEESNNNSQDNSLNTTNDISDLAPDTESERVGSVELDASSGSVARQGKLSADYRSRSVPDGIGAGKGSGAAGPSGAGFTSLGPMKMSEAMSDRLSNEPSGSSSSGGSGISEDLRERILTTSKSFEEVKAQGVAAIEVLEDKTERPGGEPAKPMERVPVDQKEALEDISEESEHTVGGGGGGNSSNTDDEQQRIMGVKVTSRQQEGASPVPGNLIERGKEMRSILEEKLLQKQHSVVGSTIYEDNKENIPEGGSLKAGPEFDSVISLKMFQTMENEIRKLHEIIATKDVLLNAYGGRKEGGTAQGKETNSCSSRAESLREQPPCRSHNSDSISMATNSTEYRPVGELADMASAEKDLYGKIMERNQWIELLADKLKESLQERNQLQSEGEKLAAEVTQLKKQLAETVESMKLKAQSSSWAGVRPPDQESTSGGGGQRISEISIDLVSETEDGGLSDFPDLYDDPPLGATERLLEPPGCSDFSELNPMHIPLKISKQLEQFRRYLAPDEVRLFNMVQGKFDDFLTQELDKVRDGGETENRVLREQLQIERAEKEQEVNRLRQMLGSVKAGSIEIVALRTELEARHTQEMADLRTYFEKKVVDLEKQYSEEVFSQQSRRLSNDDTASEISGAEEFPEENGGYQSKHTSPRRKHKEGIYLSPTHRKITPTTIDATDASADEVLVVEIIEEQEHRHLSAEEVREFYQSKIKELNAQHERVFANLRGKLKAYEAKEQEKHVLSNQTASTSSVVKDHCSPMLTNEPQPPPTPPPPKPSVDRRPPSPTDTSDAANIHADDAPLTNPCSSDTNKIVQERPEQVLGSIRLQTPTSVGELGSDSDLQEIIDGYERRLQEQVALARQDVLKELEVQIQALLSDSSFEDSHWPPELVLLREKFTAKSQLEIAQLQLKHEEEMARMRNDFEKQLQRKLKRHTTFDSSRGLDKIISERDNLRELSSTLRNVVGGLAKYFSICEEDLNSTVLEELHRYQQLQQQANESQQTVDLGSEDGQTHEPSAVDCSANESALNVTDVSFLASCKLLKFAPDVSGIISIIEDPSLVEYVSAKAQQQRDDGTEPENISLNLEECLERLRAEALSLLALSERIKQKSSSGTTTKEDESDRVSEKNDSCEEEDGLKRRGKALESARSFDENIGRQQDGPDRLSDAKSNGAHGCRSLPIDLTGLQLNGELNMQLHELKNRLLKSEDERKLLESELAEARSKQSSLVSELSETKQHLLELNSQRVEFSEGYGTNALLPTAQRVNNSFVELQERAKVLLGSTTGAGADQTIEDSSMLLQLVEDFCREGERYLEDGKRDRMDLQLQIEAADKQLKATRQFLEDQAAEREQERDEFVKEIERLKGAMREKEKDKVNFERASKEEGLCVSDCRYAKECRAIAANLESMEQQVKELTTQIADRDDRLRKMEADLKDSIDKGFTLREIISELETQIESKTINEHVLETKVKELEKYIDVQNLQNESLHHEMESVRTDLAGRGYDAKIAKLEEELRQRQPSAEQSIVLEALTVQLRDIEETLDRKTKNLETLHSTSGASVGCSSPSEDVSVNQDSPLHRQRRSAGGAGGDGAAEEDGGSPNGGGDKPKVTPLPVDEVQRIFDKLHRHSRVEDVAIKRINDLEMQISNIRGGYAELQHERDVLQEKMSEQSLKISSLQTKLDEQRLRAEELHRQGTSQLTVKVHDLQNELHNLKETLQTRDKQIVNLKQFLENSQQAIARQEKELAMNQDGAERSQHEQRLEAELKAKEEEIRVLKERIKNEMINKAALPDLMETMLADKNEEIDQLKERLAQMMGKGAAANPRHDELVAAAALAKDDDGGRTLSDVVSITDCDESDMVMRRMPEQHTLEGILPAHSIPMDSGTSLLPNHSKQSSVPLGGHILGGSHDSTMLNSIPLRSNFFHDVCSVVPRIPDQTRSSAPTPECVPRQIDFSLADVEGTPHLNAQRLSAPPQMLMFFGASATASGPRALVREPAFIEEIVEGEELNDAMVAAHPAQRKAPNEVNSNPEGEVESLKLSLDRVVTEKNEQIEGLKGELQEKIERIEDLQVELAARNKLYEDLMQERKELRDEVEKVKQELGRLDQQAHDMQQKEAELRVALEQVRQKEIELGEVNSRYEKVRTEAEDATKEASALRGEQQRQKLEVDTLRQQVESLNKTIGHKDELMSKLEKDLLNYSKNEEKYLEQLRSLDAKETELKIMQGNYKDRLHEIEILNEDNRFLTEDINRLKNEIARSNNSLSSNSSYVQTLKQNCTKLEEELQETKVLLTEKMLALERVRIDLTGCQQEMEDLRSTLKEKEMIIQQIGADGNSLHEALSNIQEKMQEKNVTLNGKLREEQERNAQLQSEVERLKQQLQRSDNSSSPKPFSVEEIAEQLERELNYSAQLDSSILKAIESDDMNTDDDRQGSSSGAAGRKPGPSRKPSDLDELRQKLQLEMDKGKKMHELLEGEKQNSAAIQQQDAEIIEAMRIRLEAALGNETTLQRLLEEERTKNERLSRMVGGLQRTKSFDNYLLMKGGKGSPQDGSPQRRLNRSNEFETEMMARYESELKFLTAQNARERERTADLQRVLERERERFEREITERTEHGEQVKKELNRVLKEKETLELELDHEQERLELAHKEIESLEKRIGALQEAEALRSARRERTSGQNSLEYQELKLRLESVEFERNQLRDTVQSLRSEVDRRRVREAHLTEALSRENSLNAQNQQQQQIVPEEFLNKLKDLNRMLESNARENQQQAESLRFMMEERRALQQRIQELERYNVHGSGVGHYHQREDLEERANHLFGKYLRSESHRKALVHQKRYLQIVLATYEENEAKALALLNAQLPPGQMEVLALASGPRSLDSSGQPRRKSFRSIVTVIVSIERMKYLVRKWHGGRRVCAKAIFSQPFSPRRSQSASTNVWARSPGSHFVEYGTGGGGAGGIVRMERAEPIPPQVFSVSAGGGAFARTLAVPAGSPTSSSLRMSVDVLETLREHQHPHQLQHQQQAQYNRNIHGNR